MKIKSNQRNVFLVSISSLALILLFVYSASSKLIDLEKFVGQIQQSPLLSDYAKILALVVPLLEFFLALLLLFDKTRLVALFGSYYLMILFTCYIVTITQFSDFIPCSCGGVLEIMSWSQHIFFNLLFIGTTMMGILLHQYVPISNKNLFAIGQGKPKTCIRVGKT